MGVYSGIVRDNLLAEGGTLNDVTLTNASLTSAVVAASSLRVPSHTAANIADDSSAVNTVNKAAGAVVLDSTNEKLKVALGSGATDNWVDADGTNAVTPS